MRKVIALVILLNLLIGCSYVSQTVLPDDINKVNLKPVKNSTFYSGLGEKLTIGLSQELAADNRVQLTDEEVSDAVLTVDISNYAKKAVDIDERGRAREYEITLTAKATLFDKIRKRVFWSDEGIESSASYTTSLSSADDLTSEVEGVDEALDDLAADIAHRVIYGW